MKQLTNYEKVRAFHKAFGLDLDAPVTKKLMSLRESLHTEELVELNEEVIDCYDNEHITPNFIKEIADVLYVTYGFCAAFGIDIDTAFNRVHESNMSKLGNDGKPIYREDGKVLKSENYRKPCMDDLVP